MINTFRGFSGFNSISHRMLHNTYSSVETSNQSLDHLLKQMRTYKQSSPIEISSFLENDAFQLDPDSLTEHLWKTMPINSESTHEIKPYRRAISQVVEPILAKYCPNSDSILEIGSGTFPIMEFLPNLKNKNQICLSDINDDCLQFLKTHYSAATIHRLDILSCTQANPTYQCVVMNDVLNTFSNNELERAFKGIDNILLPEGYLIHFSIREACFNHTLDEFKNEDLIYLPICCDDNLWKGIYVMNSLEFMYFTHAIKHSHSMLHEVLLEYASLDPLERDDICCESLIKNDFSLFRDLFECMEKFNCAITKKVFFEEHFQERMKLALDKSNYDVVKFQEEEGQYIGPRCEDPHMLNFEKNIFSINRMLRRMNYFETTFPPEMIQERAVVHTLIAQKPKLGRLPSE